MVGSELLSVKIFLVKATLKIGQDKYIFIIDSVWKTNPWTHNVKDLNW